MPIVDPLLTWVHLLSASIWVGGSISIGVVLGPMLNTLAGSPDERTMMMRRIGRKFNTIAMPALAALVATGIYNAYPFLSSPDSMLGTTYGSVLVAKIALVASMIAVFTLHVIISGSGIERRLANAHNPGAPRMEVLRRRIIWLGRIIVAESIAILFLAAILDSGI